MQEIKTPLTVEALNCFLQCNEGHAGRSLGRGMRVQPRILLSHGSISVQASTHHYCTPRDLIGPYSHVEVGLPSRKIDCLMPYAEEADKPCETVYGRVPIEIAVQAINELENEE